MSSLAKIEILLKIKMFFTKIMSQFTVKSGGYNNGLAKLDHYSRTKWLMALSSFWLILNQHISNGVIIYGVLALVLIYYRRGLTNFRFPITYLSWLLWQMLQSAWNVSLIILRNQSLTPKADIFTSKLGSEASKVWLANSITLTPGTLTVNLEDNQLLIHCLNTNNNLGAEIAEMEERISNASL